MCGRRIPLCVASTRDKCRAPRGALRFQLLDTLWQALVYKNALEFSSTLINQFQHLHNLEKVCQNLISVFSFRRIENLSFFLSFNSIRVLAILAMADYNNENQYESAEQFADPAQQQPEQIDEGNQEISDFKSRVGGPVTDDTNFGAPQEDSSEGVGIPKNYEGGEQGEYNTGDRQQQQTDSADGGVPPAQEEQKYEDNASAPGYDDKSALGDTDGTGSFDQPTTDQTQLGTDQTTNGGYDAGTQPPGENLKPQLFGYKGVR